MRGIVRQVKQVKLRATSLARLILELGQLEAKRKAAARERPAVLGITAGVFAFYAVGLLLAAAAAGLNETLSLWISLLIVAVAVLLVAACCALRAIRSARTASPPVPSQAVDEARRTADTLKTHA